VVTLPQVLSENPRAADQEWTALTLVEPAAVPTPTPLAADLTGDATAVPTV
jgi:hypothetical protein